MRSLIAAVSLLALLASTPWLAADESPGSVIFDMDSMVFKPGEFTKDNQKHLAGTAELVDGKFGKAVKFTFVEASSGGFMIGPHPPDERLGQGRWLQLLGQRDGSASWGGIELIDRDDFGLRYGYCFPDDSTDWRKITVPWRDLIPEAGRPAGHAPGWLRPQPFRHFLFGKWFFWRDYPAHSLHDRPDRARAARSRCRLAPAHRRPA